MTDVTPKLPTTFSLALRQAIAKELDHMQYKAAEGLAEQLCPLVGHLPVGDQCGLPAHDYCVGCGKRVPHQAKRTET